MTEPAPSTSSPSDPGPAGPGGRGRRRWALLVLALLVCTGLLAAVALAGGRIQYENELLENLQAGSLAGAMVLALFAAVRCKEPVRYVYLALALHCFGFFLREVDLEDFDLPAIVIYLGKGDARYTMLEVLWAIVLVTFFARHRGEAWRTSMRWLRGEQGLCAIVSFALYVVGMVFDKTAVFGLHWDKLVEELLELNGTVLLLVAALLALLSTRAAPAERRDRLAAARVPDPPS